MEITQIRTMRFDENCYLVSKDKKAFIIDPGGEVETVEKITEEKGITLEYIILTHGHVDHMFNVLNLKKQYPDLKLIASVHEKELLEDSALNLSDMLGKNSIELKADRFVKGGEVLDFCQEDIEFIDAPGHTKGSMLIKVGKDLFTGDTLFKGSIGRTDLPTGSMVDMKNTLSFIKEMEPSLVVYPGHGPSSTISTETKTNPFLTGEI